MCNLKVILFNLHGFMLHSAHEFTRDDASVNQSLSDGNPF